MTEGESVRHVKAAAAKVARGGVDVTQYLDRSPLRLELGCGGVKRFGESVGVDILADPAVDIVADALLALQSFPDGAVDEIYSEHFMEHIEDPRRILAESARVLRPGGSFRAVIPHFSNPWFYSDPTHRSFFGLYTFAYWVETTTFRRKVPQYDNPLPFDLVGARHVFKSSRPFFVRHAAKKAVSWWVNLNSWTQEFYEEAFSALLPCHEIDYTLCRR